MDADVLQAYRINAAVNASEMRVITAAAHNQPACTERQHLVEMVDWPPLLASVAILQKDATHAFRLGKVHLEVSDLDAVDDLLHVHVRYRTGFATKLLEVRCDHPLSNADAATATGDYAR